MTYLPRPQAPALSRRQADRMNRWWAWHRETERIHREAFAAFQAGDMAKFLELDAAAKALPEPDKFNG